MNVIHESVILSITFDTHCESDKLVCFEFKRIVINMSNDDSRTQQKQKSEKRNSLNQGPSSSRIQLYVNNKICEVISFPEMPSLTSVKITKYFLTFSSPISRSDSDTESNFNRKTKERNRRLIKSKSRSPEEGSHKKRVRRDVELQCLKQEVDIAWGSLEDFQRFPFEITIKKYFSRFDKNIR